MNNENVPSRKPPYCPTEAFSQLFDRLRQRMPTTINQELLSTWGVTAGAKLLPAIKFLGIITDAGDPNKPLWQALSQSDPARFKPAVHEMLKSAYKAAFDAYPTLEDFSESRMGDVFAEIYGTSPSSKTHAARFFRFMQRYYRDTPSEEGAPPPKEVRSSSKQSRTTTPKATRVQAGNGSPASRKTGSVKEALTAPGDIMTLRVMVNVPETNNEDELLAKFTMIRRAWQRAAQ
jgi:hypothetical protein